MWFCHGLPKGEIVRNIFLCNWHILWQNALYLYLGKSKLVQDDHYKWLNWRHNDYLRTAHEKCNLLVSIPPQQKLDLSRFIKAWQMSRSIELMGFQIIANNIFNLKDYLLWVCIILIGLGKPKVYVNLFGIGEPIKLLFKGGVKRKT